jgi:ribonuclease BN (tRNA processing enzyme)
MTLRTTVFTASLLLSLLAGSLQANSEHCGDQGVWVEILGAGSGELNDGQGSPSYLIWQDNIARVLIDLGSGSQVGFEKSGASFETVEAIALTQLSPEHSGDLPAFISAAQSDTRTLRLSVLGPTGDGQNHLSTREFMQRLFGANGVYPYLANAIKPRASLGYRIRGVDVQATGNKRWAGYQTEHVKLSAIPVHSGDIPALAWRVEIDDQIIVVTGDFNNSKNLVATFAKDADALVVSHAIPENSRGALRELHSRPSQLGHIADQANARMLILGHRNARTRGRESLSRAAMEENYDGPILFANDGECWGL